jgi:hypothetical protein
VKEEITVESGITTTVLDLYKGIPVLKKKKVHGGSKKTLKMVLRGDRRGVKRASESTKATVQLRQRKLALLHRTRPATGFTATALTPWLVALVGVWEEGQRCDGLTRIIDDRYGWVARR